MKSLIKYFLYILIFSFIVLFACESDINKNIQDNDDYRDKFLGSWICNEKKEKSIELTYTVTIIKDMSNTSQVFLKNFGFIGNDEKPPYGIVTRNCITIPEQDVCDDNSLKVKGSGDLVKENKMNWEYEINDGADLNHYTAVFEKL